MLVGRTIGRFKILELIGQGGMATVYKAEDSLTGRTVAFKALADELARDPKARKRFLREGRDAARLDHPAIVPVLDSGEVDGISYIVFTLVEGETLWDRIQRAPVECDESVRIATAAAEGLGHAHENGIVHRDVSPRNVMIRRDGQVLVIDFGIALTASSTRLTTGDTTIGTIGSLAPEVALSHDAEPRSDLYSLGVVLYQLLTGMLPYPDAGPEAYVYSVINRPPIPPRQWRRDLPRALERFLLRVLSKDPVDRPANARGFVDELRAAAVEKDREEPEESKEGADPRSADSSTASIELPHPAYLAVIPFDLATHGESGEGHDALAGGLAAALGSALGGIPGVHLIALPPFSTLPLDDLPRLARQLGANLVLCGSVRRSGTEVRVGWSLILPHRGLQVASGTVDGSSVDLFALEDRLAVEVRRALGGSAAAHAASRARDPAAREHYLQALGYLRRFDHAGSIEGAIVLLENLLEREGASGETCTALARAYLCKHRLTFEKQWERKAEAMCQRAAEIDPNGVEVAVALGDLRAHAGWRDRAMEDYRRALSLRPEHPDALGGLARVVRAAGRPEEAERYAEAAVAAQPDDWRHHTLLGIVRLDQGRYDDAIEPFTRVVALTPDNAWGHLNLATAHYLRDDLEKALTGFRKSLEYEAQSSTYVNLGTVLYDLGRHQEAIEAYRKATALRPLDPRVWGHFGSALRWLPGHEEECRESLSRAIVLVRERIDQHSGSGEDWSLLASWLSNLGQDGAAFEAIERALTLAPDDVIHMVRAAEVYELAGDRERARTWLAKALQHGYRTGILRRNPALVALVRSPEVTAMLRKQESNEGVGDEKHGGSS